VNAGKEPNAHDELVLQQISEHPPIQSDTPGREELLAELASKVIDLELRSSSGTVRTEVEGGKGSEEGVVSLCKTYVGALSNVRLWARQHPLRQ
jgi:hypothetical protein